MYYYPSSNLPQQQLPREQHKLYCSYNDEKEVNIIIFTAVRSKTVRRNITIIIPIILT